jgi:hypothetical protein
LEHNSLKSIWDVLLFGIPLLLVLFFTHFRLDEVFASRKSTRLKAPEPPTVSPFDESSMYRDPDGRAWDQPASGKR